MKLKKYKCENCGNLQVETEFGECSECGYEELLEVAEESTEFKVDLNIYADRQTFKGSADDLESLIINLLEKNGLDCQIYKTTEREY